MWRQSHQPDKHGALAALGAHLIDRHSSDPVSDARDALGAAPTVVADVVGGAAFGSLIDALAPGGRYVTAGAIAGPLVELDLRTLYLNNLEFYGSSTYRRDTFPQLLDVLAAGGIDPIVDSQWPLDQIVSRADARFSRRPTSAASCSPFHPPGSRPPRRHTLADTWPA